jgi:hypothetical protein
MKNEFFERLTLALEARGWTPTRLEREAKFSKGHLSKGQRWTHRVPLAQRDGPGFQSVAPHFE